MLWLYILLKHTPRVPQVHVRTSSKNYLAKDFCQLGAYCHVLQWGEDTCQGLRAHAAHQWHATLHEPGLGVGNIKDSASQRLTRKHRASVMLLAKEVSRECHPLTAEHDNALLLVKGVLARRLIDVILTCTCAHWVYARCLLRTSLLYILQIRST